MNIIVPSVYTLCTVLALFLLSTTMAKQEETKKPSKPDEPGKSGEPQKPGEHDKPSEPKMANTTKKAKQGKSAQLLTDIEVQLMEKRMDIVDQKEIHKDLLRQREELKEAITKAIEMKKALEIALPTLELDILNAQEKEKGETGKKEEL